MPFTIQTAQADNPNIPAHGGVARITAALNDPSQTFQGVLFSDSGDSMPVALTLQPENVVYTVDATKKGQPGYLYLALAGAPSNVSVDVAPDGQSFEVRSA